MVSHDVKEVVFMATRIVVMAARPGRVRTIIENPLPYPRDPRAREFLRLVDRIHGIITEVEMPDEPAAPAGSGKPVWEPLPAASASEIIGLLEVVDDHDGRENVFRLVDEIGREFGEVLMVVKAGELLDFLDTPKQEVVLTELGRRFLAASIPERKELWRLQVLQLDVFKAVVAQTRASERQELDDDVVKSQLALHLPFEESERLFQTLVNWGRHADLFDHDPARGKILVSSTDERPPPPPSRRPPPPRPASCADLIAPEAITLALAATDRRGAIAELSRLLAGPSGLPGEQIRELLLKREDLGTTALGGGLAVPHERAEVDRVIGALGLSREGIDFGAPDGKPVRIVVALLSPMTGNNHLKALAAIAQTLADPSLRAKLLAARTAEEAHALFAQAG
jgi:mannitol/fructose-specific phosphotransferase system IIA component (Ntr-type)